MAEDRRQDEKAPHFQPVAKPFAFGGVWDVWKGDGKEPIISFSIVTTSPAPSTAHYHDRMPVVLEESQFEDWMRGPAELAVEMMKPYGGEIEVWEVGRDVGNVRNNKPRAVGSRGAHLTDVLRHASALQCMHWRGAVIKPQPPPSAGRSNAAAQTGSLATYPLGS